MPHSATPWTAACGAPLSIGFPRQEHRRELPLPSPGMFLTQPPASRTGRWFSTAESLEKPQIACITQIHKAKMLTSTCRDLELPSD